jgi:three-Cys-motif partner protein
MTLIIADDGLHANDDIGEWAKEKHEYLTRYLNISSATRKKYLGIGKAGATYIDLFCATGRGRVRGSLEWIDGSPITAWNASVARGSPFSMMYIADVCEESLKACVSRLERLKAPVKAYLGSAAETVSQICNDLNPYGLHFAFIDPYNLESLHFSILEKLSRLQRMDILIHFSAMDFNRNLLKYVKSDASKLDNVIPGWRDRINASTQESSRNQLIRLWRNSLKNLGTIPSSKQKLIRGNQRQPLYWLVLAAQSQLAHRFWEIAANTEKQQSLF